MNLTCKADKEPSQENLLLALHSCSETLGIALLDVRTPQESLRSSTFCIDRNLSNNIFNFLEELLPASEWTRLARISVAIGPGRFTGTRLTVVLARTLAQQLNCNLDGVSSFALMAPRLESEIAYKKREEPFWVIKDLPRRGLVAGKYQIEKSLNKKNILQVLELEKPHLLGPNVHVNPAIDACENVAEDVVRMLQLSFEQYKAGEESPWYNILPIYPTSPVESYK